MNRAGRRRQEEKKTIFENVFVDFSHRLAVTVYSRVRLVFELKRNHRSLKQQSISGTVYICLRIICALSE